MSGKRRAVATAAACLAVLVAGVITFNALSDAPPSGTAGSSFATQPEGLAAWADVLTAAGHPVTRLTTSPEDVSLDPTTTLVVFDPAVVTSVEADAIQDFLAAGGRLVATDPSGTWLGRIVASPPRTTGPVELGGTARPVAPVTEVTEVTTVTTDRRGGWTTVGSALPILQDSKSTVAAVAAVGTGRALLLADGSPLTNRLLAQTDNATFAVALVGDANRAVVFAESFHGYGRSTGLAAVPRRWIWTLGGLGLAALVLLVAQSRRLGIPDRPNRRLPPGRGRYANAVGALLAKHGDSAEAIVVFRDRARTLLAPRGEATQDELYATALRAGLSDDEAQALLSDDRPTSDMLVQAGRALARLETRRGGGI